MKHSCHDNEKASGMKSFTLYADNSKIIERCKREKKI